jgi:hypothetical protein
MSLLDKLEKAIGRWAIPNLTLFLVMGQVFVVMTTMFKLIDEDKLVYAPILVMRGEWWRLFTFMFQVTLPTSTFGWVFLAFGWYLFYLMGSALEAYWGVFRYNVYLLVSYVLLVGLAFLTPNYAVENMFILGSVFLAFAYLNPDFEMILFFILPVKIKWLAFVYTAVGAAMFFRGDLAVRIQIGASIGGFILFFGRDILRRLGLRNPEGSRRPRTEEKPDEREPRHVCHVCGKTDVTHPQLDFRYCSKCAGDQCYCPEHIQNHHHVVAKDSSAASR